jgi:hypothetical protein
MEVKRYMMSRQTCSAASLGEIEPGTAPARLPNGRSQTRAKNKLLGQVISALNAFHEQHGCLSDEFPSL